MKHQPYLVIFCTILSIGGLLSGVFAWLFLPDMLSDELRRYVLSSFQTMTAITIKESVLQIIRVNMMDLLRVYLCGVCLLGVPILIIFLFLKCFSIGLSSCLLIQSSVLLFICRLLFVPILWIAVMKAYRFSLSLLTGSIQSPIRQLLQYTAFFAALLLGMIAVSTIDGLAVFYYLQRL